jgi:hypothetical protein
MILIPLNKIMRQMDNSGIIDLTLIIEKVFNAGGIDKLSIGTRIITSQRSRL